MGWQLIYTSSARSLKAGQSGFGTVARHREMRDRLVEAIERVSSYERGGIQSAPRIDSHRVVDIAGDTYHILTRIRDAGSDYSGRTNHLAHHVVFTAEEVESSDISPADFLAGWRGWRCSWNESARYLGPEEIVDLAGMPRVFTLPARHWANRVGDAGLAACLSPSAEVYLAVEPGREDELLPLIGESMALVGEVAWRVSFTTVLKSNDRAGDYQWRGYWKGSAAEAIARSRRMAVIDWSNMASLAAPDPILADYARTGVPPKPVDGKAQAVLPIRRVPAVLLEPPPPSVSPRPSVPAGATASAALDQPEIQRQEPATPWRSLGIAIVPIVVTALLAIITFGVFGTRISDVLSGSKHGPAGGAAPGPATVATPIASPEAPVVADRAGTAPQAQPIPPPPPPPMPKEKLREPDVVPVAAFLEEDWGRYPTMVAGGPFRSLEVTTKNRPSRAACIESLCDALEASVAPSVLVATNDVTRTRPLELRAKKSEEMLRCYLDDGFFLTIEWTPRPRRFIAISTAGGIPAIHELRIGPSGAGGRPLAIFATPRDRPPLGRRSKDELRPSADRIGLTSPAIAARLGMIFGSGDLVLRIGERAAPLVSIAQPGEPQFNIADWAPEGPSQKTNRRSAPAPNAAEENMLDALNDMRAGSNQNPVTSAQISSQERFLAVLGDTIRAFVGSVKRHAGRFFEASANYDSLTRFGVTGDAWAQLASFDLAVVLKRNERAPKDLERSTVEKWTVKQEQFISSLQRIQKGLTEFRNHLETNKGGQAIIAGAVNPGDLAGARIEISPFARTGQNADVVLVEFE